MATTAPAKPVLEVAHTSHTHMLCRRTHAHSLLPRGACTCHADARTHTPCCPEAHAYSDPRPVVLFMRCWLNCAVGKQADAEPLQQGAPPAAACHIPPYTRILPHRACSGSFPSLTKDATLLLCPAETPVASPKRVRTVSALLNSPLGQLSPQHARYVAARLHLHHPGCIPGLGMLQISCQTMRVRHGTGFELNVLTSDFLVFHAPLTFNAWPSSTNNVQQSAVCLTRVLKLLWRRFFGRKFAGRKPS